MPICSKCSAEIKGKRIKQALPGTSRKAAKEAKRQRHAEETERIRKARMKIAQDRCEWMVGEPPMRCGIIDPLGRELHMHHLEGGNGRRRQRQTVENVRMLCRWHHFEAHKASKRAGSPTGGRDTHKEST